MSCNGCVMFLGLHEQVHWNGTDFSCEWTGRTMFPEERETETIHRGVRKQNSDSLGQIEAFRHCYSQLCGSALCRLAVTIFSCGGTKQFPTNPPPTHTHRLIQTDKHTLSHCLALRRESILSRLLHNRCTVQDSAGLHWVVQAVFHHLLPEVSTAKVTAFCQMGKRPPATCDCESVGHKS